MDLNMNGFAQSIANLASRNGSVSSQEITDLLQLADKLGIKLHVQLTSEKFAEISFVGNVTAFDEKLTVGTVTVTLKLLH